MDIHKKSRSLLFLMQLVSSNFPTGGFSYSRGLELAVESGWVNSIKSFIDWQKQWINGQLTYLEFPMLKRCYYYTNINDSVSFKRCAIEILSYRDTSELRLEEKQRGKAISKLILQWHDPVDNCWVSAFEYSGLASIAWLGCVWNISIKNLALGYAYNMLESSIMTGLKLVPFGQNTSQKLLRYLIGFIPYAWDQSNMIKNNKFGSNFLLQSIASSCHETQYSRLFRS